MAPSVPRPTPAELEILRVLWQRGPSTVRDVHETLNRSGTSGPAPTSTRPGRPRSRPSASWFATSSIAPSTAPPPSW
jgi:penicillinase repressor